MTLTDLSGIRFDDAAAYVTKFLVNASLVEIAAIVACLWFAVRVGKRTAFSAACWLASRCKITGPLCSWFGIIGAALAGFGLIDGTGGHPIMPGGAGPDGALCFGGLGMVVAAFVTAYNRDAKSPDWL